MCSLLLCFGSSPQKTHITFDILNVTQLNGCILFMQCICDKFKVSLQKIHDDLQDDPSEGNPLVPQVI